MNSLRAGRSGNRIPVWGEIFRTLPGRPWGPPSLLYDRYRDSPGGKERPGRGVDHPPQSSAEVKERVELYLYAPSGPSWPVLEWTLTFIFSFTFPATIDVLTAVLMTQVFYNVTPYRLIYCYRRFERLGKSSWITPTMKAESSYKTLVIIHRCTDYRFPEVLNFQCLSYLWTSSKAAH